MVERVGAVEHLLHGRDARGVPLPDIHVELSLVLEQLRHVRHLRHVPQRHFHKTRSAAVHVGFGAARHTGGVADGGIQAAIDRSQEISLVRERRALTRCRVLDRPIDTRPRAVQGVPGVARWRAGRSARQDIDAVAHAAVGECEGGPSRAVPLASRRVKHAGDTRRGSRNRVSRLARRLARASALE